MNSLIISENTHQGNLASNEIRLNLNQSVKFSNQQVALSLLTMYYSWRNITTAYGNNSFSYIYNSVTYPVVMPDGFYLIDDISNYLELTMDVNNHWMLDADGERVYFLSIAANETYYRITITADVIAVPVGGSNPNTLVTGSTMQLVIPDTNFKKVLGFANASYPTSPSVSAYSVNGTEIPIISSVSSILVTCNIVNNELNQYPDVISVFSPNDRYASLLRIEPNNFVWNPVFDGAYYSISLRFFDQNFIPLDILDKTSLTASLVLKNKEI